MNKLTRYSVLLVIIIVLVGLFVWYKKTPGPYDNLATCLSNKGVKFYGAFWCSACKSQKQAFSKSAAKLPYTECSTPDGKEMLEACKNIGIQKYPTWEFPDGTREVGVTTPELLAEKTSCPVN